MGLFDWFGDKRKPSVPDALWAQTVAALPFLSALAVDEKKALKLLAQYPALIKRPVLDTGTRLLVGFTPETYTAELK